MNDFANIRRIVVKALVGSHNYNLNTASSDKDFKYFVMPFFEDLYRGTFYSKAEHGDGFDSDIHDIRKLPELIWKANINFVEVLFSKDLTYEGGLSFVFENSERWATMNLPAFKNATYGTHLMKMKKLHDKYDAKSASHALRCLYVLSQYVACESMAHALWFTGEKKDILLAVKNSELTECEFLYLVREWHETDFPVVNRFFSGKAADAKAKAELDNSICEFVKNEYS